MIEAAHETAIHSAPTQDAMPAHPLQEDIAPNRLECWCAPRHVGRTSCVWGLGEDVDSAPFCGRPGVYRSITHDCYCELHAEPYMQDDADYVRLLWECLFRAKKKFTALGLPQPLISVRGVQLDEEAIALLKAQEEP